MPADSKKHKTPTDANNVLAAEQAGKDPIKLRLIFLARYWKNNENMYEGWANTNFNNRKKWWEEKRLMCVEIVHSLNKLIQEIDNGEVDMPCR